VSSLIDPLVVRCCSLLALLGLLLLGSGGFFSLLLFLCRCGFCGPLCSLTLLLLFHRFNRGRGLNRRRLLGLFF